MQAKVVSSPKKYFKPLTPNLHAKVEDFNHIHLFWPASLTHLFPVHPFSTHWKHQKTVRFSEGFRG